MARPDTMNWGGAQVEPSDGKKEIGFLPSERLASSWLNWAWGLQGQWDTYLDLKFESEAMLDQRTVQVVGVSDDWLSACGCRGRIYLGGQFGLFAVGDASGNSFQDAVAGSSDNQDYKSIDGNDSITVAVGGDNVQSATVNTWTRREQASGWTFSEVRWHAAAGVFVALAHDGGTGQRSYTSPNGISWTQHTLATGRLGVMESSGALLVASPIGASTGPFTSPDGVTWTQRTWSGAVSMGPSLGFNANRGVFAYGDVSGNRHIQVSTDAGVTWTDLRAQTGVNAGPLMVGAAGAYAEAGGFNIGDQSWFADQLASVPEDDWRIGASWSGSAGTGRPRIVRPDPTINTAIAVGPSTVGKVLLSRPFRMTVP